MGDYDISEDLKYAMLSYDLKGVSVLLPPGCDWIVTGIDFILKYILMNDLGLNIDLVCMSIKV